MTERKLPPTPNSAAAIQPQDLASPEFSYLSKVYGKRTDASVLPVEKDPPTRQPAVATRGTTPSSRGASPPAQSGPVVGSPPPRTHALPAGPPVPEHHHSLPREPAIPRKQVGSGPPSSIQSPGNHEVTDGRSASGYPLLDEGSSVSSGGDPQMPRVEQPPSSAYPSMATQHATGTSSQENVVYVGHSSDTEVITKQAPAVIHETVVPKVHHITEERIQREIHTYEVIHRIQPVIDVQVLPPRHFVPDGNGGLREVSADEIPGRLGHWGIVETVTKERPGETFLPLGPSEPQIISQRSYVTEDGIRRTETTWKHPPRLETRARDAGETWPLAICPEAFAEKHGALRIAAPPNERVTSAFTSDAAVRATATPSDLPDNRSPPHGVEIMGTGRSRDANVVTPPASKPTPALAPRDTPSVESDGPKGTPSVAPAYMSPPASGPLHRSSPGPQEPRSPRRDLDGSKKPLPGAFPSVSSDSTTTMSTFAEQQER